MKMKNHKEDRWVGQSWAVSFLRISKCDMIKAYGPTHKMKMEF